MRLSSIFSQLKKSRVMVVGDLVLDSYTIGSTRRISPEAPVPVVHVKEVRDLPGGAGNVALNLAHLGAEVVVVGRIGKDIAGEKVKAMLLEKGIDVRGLFVDSTAPTPIKNRILASGQQMMRIDYETIHPISKKLEEEVIALVPNLLDGIEVVAISDYGKGLLTQELLQALIKEAKNRNIPIITDPKGCDFSKYAGTTVIKPNFGEALAVAGLGERADLQLIAERVLRASLAEELVITRSESGMSYFKIDGTREDFPIKMREVRDVTGAGDTVLAILALAMGSGVPLTLACNLANIAGGLAVEVVGCAQITLKDLARRLLEEDAENKVFDEHHLFVLKEVLQDEECIVLGLEKGTTISSELFQALHAIKKEGSKLLVYLKDPGEELIQLLSELQGVDYLIFAHTGFLELCHLIQPKELYIFKGRCLQKIEEAALITKDGRI